MPSALPIRRSAEIPKGGTLPWFGDELAGLGYANRLPHMRRHLESLRPPDEAAFAGRTSFTASVRGQAGDTMMAMRCLLGLVCGLSLTAADVTQLRQLQAKNRIFQLRETLQQPGWNDSATLFYRALVEGRFGHEAAAIEDLRQLLAAYADPDTERQAYEELASALVRIGHYGEAARAWADALRLTPLQDEDRADSENTRALYESLGDVAPQTIQFGKGAPIEAKHTPLGSWDVPVEVNGRRGDWVFDTGANLSAISESEASRMELATRETSAYVRGSTEKKNPLRLAVARDLGFGSARLSNVVFLVLSDKALYVGPLKYQIRGILGFPVLRALGQVGISAAGLVRIEAETAGAAGEPNLFFDGLSPIVQAGHEGHWLQMFLDTGANASFVYPSFRDTLTRDEISKLRRKRDRTGGAGGIVSRRTEVVPTLQLAILGRDVELTNVSLLVSQPAGDGRYRDGVLAMDGLVSGFTLDFRRMQLRLD